MKKWQLWLSMAEESARAAVWAESGQCPRSSVSRYYYSAYQAATALLHYIGLIPPSVSGQPRDAWSHLQTPGLIRDCVASVIMSRPERNRLRKSLVALYSLRLAADYASAPVQAADVYEARRSSGQILNSVRRIVR